MRCGEVIAYDGKKWILLDKRTTIDNIIDKYEDVIERKYYELKNELDESTIRKLDRFIEQHASGESKEQYKKDLTLLMYNNKDLIKSNKYIEAL